MFFAPSRRDSEYHFPWRGGVPERISWVHGAAGGSPAQRTAGNGIKNGTFRRQAVPDPGREATG
jgi:hypothetical protein